MSQLFGLLNLDKPMGVTSRDAVDIVQRLVRPAKVGHAGTLDPLATGVLVVCVGPATRLIPFIQKDRKIYRATFRLGVASETDDLEGTLVPVTGAPVLTGPKIEAVLPEFVGTIEQVPPAYSAVHVSGKRAYDLARRGETPMLTAKPVQVFRFDLLSFDGGVQEFECEIECGSGTYIRSLGRDLGRRLGTGAVMTALRRTAVGAFRTEEAISPNHLTLDRIVASIRPPDAAFQGRPRVMCDDGQVAAIRNGRAVPLPAGFRLAGEDPVGLFDHRGQFVAVGSFDPRDATLKPKIVFPFA